MPDSGLYVAHVCNASGESRGQGGRGMGRDSAAPEFLRRPCGVTTQLEDEQCVLSEASHDLANRFHRSYYLLELLSDALSDVPEAGGAAELIERLKDTIEDIESLARRTFQFVRPLELRTIRVPLEDLVASLQQHAGMQGLEVRGERMSGRCEVAVDPARISEALAAISEALGSGQSSPLPIHVEFLGGDPVGLRIGLDAGTGPAPAPHLALAVAARIVRMHGGNLGIDETTDGRAPSFTLRLPVAPPGVRP